MITNDVHRLKAQLNEFLEPQAQAVLGNDRVAYLDLSQYIIQYMIQGQYLIN
jgi:hypothetical protein